MENTKVNQGEGRQSHAIGSEKAPVSYPVLLMAVVQDCCVCGHQQQPVYTLAQEKAEDVLNLFVDIRPLREVVQDLLKIIATVNVVTIDSGECYLLNHCDHCNSVFDEVLLHHPNNLVTIAPVGLAKGIVCITLPIAMPSLLTEQPTVRLQKTTLPAITTLTWQQFQRQQQEVYA